MLLIKLTYVLCFSKQTQNKMMVDENIRVILRVFQRAIEDKRKDAVNMFFRLLSFFSSQESIKLQIVNMLNVKTLFQALNDGTGLDRKFILSILVDVIANSQMHQIVKTLSWT